MLEVCTSEALRVRIVDSLAYTELARSPLYKTGNINLDA